MTKYTEKKPRIAHDDVESTYREFLKKFRKAFPHLKEASFHWKLNYIYSYGGYVVEEQEGVLTVGYPFGMKRRNASEMRACFEYGVDIMEFFRKVNSTTPLEDCPEENLK